MPLIRSPLFTAHAAAGAQFIDVDGWILPGHYRTVEEEVQFAARDAVSFDLAGRGVFSMVGPDALRFCNGMFTQNIRNLPEGSTARSALTDEKGKMLGLISIARTDVESLIVLCDGIPASAFLERYGKFIILDDVELDDLSATRAAFHVAGPRAREALSGAGLGAPEVGRIAIVDDITILSRDRIGREGFDVLTTVERVTELWESVRAAGVLPAGVDAMEWLRISAGHVRWPIDMGERALVHEMRLVASCCSFEKGCYIGQEVINRIDVMGQVNKKLFGLEMQENAIPPEGAEVRMGEEAVGVARSGARCGGRARVLAVLRKAAWAPGTEVTVHADGRAVPALVSELPFLD